MRRIGRRRRAELAALVEFRRAVQVRASGYCEGQAAGVCRGYSHFGSQAHHVVPKARGGGNEPENGLWLCVEAHNFVHTNVALATSLGLLRSANRASVTKGPLWPQVPEPGADS